MSQPSEAALTFSPSVGGGETRGLGTRLLAMEPTIPGGRGAVEASLLVTYVSLHREILSCLWGAPLDSGLFAAVQAGRP